MAWLIRKGQSDSYSLHLGYKAVSASRALPQYSRHSVGEDGQHYDTVTLTWTEEDKESAVLERLAGIQADANLVEEHVRVRFRLVSPEDPGGVVSAIAPAGGIAVSMAVRRIPPTLRSLELRRSNSSSSTPPPHLQALLMECALEEVWRLKCAEGLMPVWDTTLFPRWQSLTCLVLNSCSLAVLSTMVGRLTNLRELHVSANRLAQLPRELGLLRRLQTLKADDNLLTALPVELRQCTALEILSLENNRLAAPVVDLSHASGLRSLQLYGNPLELLPELSPCASLRHLSLANARISADEDFEKWTVEVVSTASYISRAHKLAPLCALIFRHSSVQHPLLAGALAQLAGDEGNCAYIASLEGAIPQIVLMGLSDSDIVVGQACQLIGQLSQHSPATAQSMVAANVVSTLCGLLASSRHRSQVCGLRELARLALVGDAIASQLLTPGLLAALLEAARIGAHDVQGLALEALGNLAFTAPNREMLRAEPRVRPLLVRLASRTEAVPKRVRIGAIRALATLGENEAVRRAVGRAPISGRGVRILAMDGGGMKGLATLRMLWALQERTGRQMHELFDLVCGTSTGGILAAALAIRCVPLEECEEIYRVLGAKVFSRPLVTKGDVESWRDSFYRVYKSSQQSVRVAVYGCKHDAAMFEVVLKEYCKFQPELGLLGDLMIDTACLDIPKVFVVSTLASATPAAPFLLRNYEHSAAGAAAAKRIGACQQGASNFALWESVRASSAAAYYLDDFNRGDDRFQDGAATANNPAALALAEARALWPDTPVDVLVSLGSGNTPAGRRERSLSTYLETGSVLIESATDTERIAGALATLAPLVPGLRYFRFCPEDPRCGMELDEINPDKWAALEAATNEYIIAEDATFDAAAAALCSRLASGTTFSASQERLGLRREVLVLHALRPSGAAGDASAVNAVARWLLQSPHATHSQGASVPPASQPDAQPQPDARLHPAGEAAHAAPAAAPGAAASAAAAASTPPQSPARKHRSQPGTPGSQPASSPAAPSTGGRQQPAEPPARPAGGAPAAAAAAGAGAGAGAGAAPAVSAPQPTASAPQRPAAHFPDATMAFTAAAQRHADRVGVVHLAMHAREGDLVPAWQQVVESVAEPGKAAEDLLRQVAPGNGASSLADVFAASPTVEAGGDVVVLLGRQQQWVGSEAVSSYLLLRTRPASLLTAMQVAGMAGVWEGQTVVTTEPLGDELAAALLTAGARALIARRTDAPPPAANQSVAFFEALYDHLLTGRTILEALKVAERHCPALAGAFDCSFSSSINTGA